MMIAATDPQMIACFCWFAGSERAANAITTALSPDSTILTMMIWPSPTQNGGLDKYSIMRVAPRSACYKLQSRRRFRARGETIHATSAASRLRKQRMRAAQT